MKAKNKNKSIIQQKKRYLLEIFIRLSNESCPKYLHINNNIFEVNFIIQIIKSKTSMRKLNSLLFLLFLCAISLISADKCISQDFVPNSDCTGKLSIFS